MATQLQTLRSIPLTAYSISTDTGGDFNNYIAGIVSANINNVRNTLSANAFVSRNGLSASSIKCNGPINATGQILTNGAISTTGPLSAGITTLNSLEFVSGYSIKRTEDTGALQITGGTTFRDDDANGRLILYGSGNRLSGNATLKAQGENGIAAILGNKSVILSGGANNSLAIRNDYISYTGSSVIGNGFTRTGFPHVGSGSTQYINGYMGLNINDTDTYPKTFQRQAEYTGWISIWAKFPASTTVKLSIKSALNGATLLVDIRRTTSDLRQITMSFPIVAGQFAELHCENKPDELTLDRFYYAIGSVVPTVVASAAPTRGVERNSTSTHTTYESIAGDVINDNGLDGLVNNGIYASEDYVESNASEPSNQR